MSTETDGIPANKPRELGMIKEERNGVFVPHTHGESHSKQSILYKDLCLLCRCSVV